MTGKMPSICLDETVVWKECFLNFKHHGCWPMNVLEGISSWVIWPQAGFDPPSFTSRAQSGSSVPTDTVSPPSGSSDALQPIPISLSDFRLMCPSRSAEYSWSMVMTQWRHLRGLTGSVLLFCLFLTEELWATVVSKTNKNTTQRSAVGTCVACSFYV